MVKLNSSQGSFGIPENMRSALDDKKKTAPTRETPVEKEVQDVGPATEERDLKTDIKPILEGLGITINEEDFQKLIFKGYIEKEVEIVKNHLKATFRSLTGQDWDEIDEILAQEAKDVPMTLNGMDIRKSVLSIAYGVTHLQGKPIAQVITDESGNPDSKAMAQARRKAILALAPMVSNIMIEKHTAFTVALTMITRNPGEYLKNF